MFAERKHKVEQYKKRTAQVVTQLLLNITKVLFISGKKLIPKPVPVILSLGLYCGYVTMYAVQNYNHTSLQQLLSLLQQTKTTNV